MGVVLSVNVGAVAEFRAWFDERVQRPDRP